MNFVIYLKIPRYDNPIMHHLIGLDSSMLSSRCFKTQTAYCIATARGEYNRHLSATPPTCPFPLPLATLPAPIALPPFPALPLPLVIPDAPSTTPPFRSA